MRWFRTIERKKCEMKDWVDVTQNFSETQRHYRDSYLEIDEVFDDVIEVSLFSRTTGLYEIYVGFEIMTGVISVGEELAYILRDEIKAALKKEYEQEGKLTDSFMKEFCGKYDMQFEFLF